MAFQRNRIRLKLELANPLDPDTAIQNRFTSAVPLVAHGRAVGFEFALFNNGVLDPLTDFVSLTLEIKDWTSGAISTGGALLTKVLALATLNAGLGVDQWENDSGNPSYHGVFTLLDTEIGALSMTGAVLNQKDFGLVISGLTANGRVLCGSGRIIVQSDGATGAGGALAPVPTYTLSNDEIFAMVALCVKAGVNPSGMTLTIPADNNPNIGRQLVCTVPPGETEPVIQWVTVPIITS